MLYIRLTAPELGAAGPVDFNDRTVANKTSINPQSPAAAAGGNAQEKARYPATIRLAPIAQKIARPNTLENTKYRQPIVPIIAGKKSAGFNKKRP
jgi:hypothetical protein